MCLDICVNACLYVYMHMYVCDMRTCVVGCIYICIVWIWYVSVCVRVSLYPSMLVCSDMCCVCVLTHDMLFVSSYFQNYLQHTCSYYLNYLQHDIYVTCVRGLCCVLCVVCCACVLTCVVMCIINTSNIKAFLLISNPSERNTKEAGECLTSNIHTNTHMYTSMYVYVHVCIYVYL
jgi:hypothetical protein